jgi:hypothetical protein
MSSAGTAYRAVRGMATWSLRCRGGVRGRATGATTARRSRSQTATWWRPMTDREAERERERERRMRRVDG